MTALRVLCAALWFAACSGGDGGGGGAAPAGSTAADQSSSVTLAWSGASGAVAGYSIYVQRGNSDFKHEADVQQNRATLSGAPGSTARVIVVAFDSAYAHGPSSPSSVQFTFPSADASSQGASAASASTAAASVASAAVSDPVASVDPLPAETADESSVPGLAGGALVWQAGDVFRLTDAAVETTRMFTRPADGAQLAGVADFDADGHGDLLWVSATSQLGYMPGDVLRGTDPISLVDLGTLAAGEQVVGAGDFDGDRHGDVLVSAAGAIHARLTAPDGAPAIADLGDSAQAALAGIADFDANGSDDIVWRASTGAIVLWLMEGGLASASVEVQLPIDFGVVGVGDFDGDGAAELAMRDPLGNVFVVHPLEATPALGATDLANTLGWTALGAVDFELDRSEELVLVTAEAIRFAGLPGDQVVALDPDSSWQLVALLP